MSQTLAHHEFANLVCAGRTLEIAEHSCVRTIMPPEFVEPSNNTKDSPAGPEAIELICEALQGLKFGMVTVIVQDGVVVQVERTEKMRLRQNREPQVVAIE